MAISPFICGVPKIFGFYKDITAAVCRGSLVDFHVRFSPPFQPRIDRSSHQFAYRSVAGSGDTIQPIKLRFWEENPDLFHVYINYMYT